MPRRRRKRHHVSLPAAAAVVRRPRGRRPSEDQAIVATLARLNRLGMPDTPENRAMARAQAAGCAAGQALMLATRGDPETAERLWGAICHARRVVVAYDAAIGAPGRHAQCLRILVPSDALHADANAPPPDLRSADERYRAAVAAWMTLQGWLDHCDRHARSIFFRHVIDEVDLPVTDWPALRRALECVADGLAGVRPIRFRGGP